MSIEQTLLRQLQHSLVLQDVYVRKADAKIIGEFDPKAEPATDCSIQLRFSVESAEHKVAPTDEPSPSIVRYSVDTGLRFVQKCADQANEPTVIAEITAVFVVDYLVRDASVITEASLKAFEENALHHAWPYWREFIHTSSGRLRLPSVILPIRQPLKKPSDATTPTEETPSSPTETNT